MSSPEPDYAAAFETAFTRLVRGDVESWNGFRKRFPDEHPILNNQGLSNNDFRGADLSRTSFVGARLDGTDLRTADLSSANISQACLNDADLTGANLAGADFGESLLEKATLRGADISGAVFRKVRLISADLTEVFSSEGIPANFEEAEMENANLERARLPGAVFLKANLNRANLMNANLRSADLTDAKLAQANLSAADLTEANLERAQASNAILDDARFQRACFTHAELRKVRSRDRTPRILWLEGTLPTVDFTEASFDGAHLDGAILPYAAFRDASLVGAVLTHADVQASDFTNARLERAHMVETFACHCDFEGANLSEAVISADLRMARLDNACFDLARIGAVDFGGASLIDAKCLFGPRRATPLNGGAQEHSVQSARFRRRLDVVPWEWLRVIGSLRLFGVSYVVLILITIYAGLAKWYNTGFGPKVREDALAKMEAGVDWKWREILSELPDLPLPQHFATQLVMIGLLAVGATFYQWRCPELVKEATETRWTRDLKESLLEYRSATWSRWFSRTLCAATFGVGGVYSILYVVVHAVEAFLYLRQG